MAGHGQFAVHYSTAYCVFDHPKGDCLQAPPAKDPPLPMMQTEEKPDENRGKTEEKTDEDRGKQRGRQRRR